MAARRPARGFTLIELLVALAVGLFVIAAAITFASRHAQERRTTISQSRLTHDLQATVDTVTRSLRRAGYWGDAAAGLAPRSAASNPYAIVALDGDALAFRYSRDDAENGTVDSNEEFGFRLRDGAVEMLLGGGRWQALTDDTSMRVTSFAITPRLQSIALDAFCDVPCPPSDAECPVQWVRSFDVALTARSLMNASIERGVQGHVRLRNDRLTGRCPA